MEQVLHHAVRTGQEHSALLDRLLATNQIIKHNFRYNALRKQVCALEGCGQMFEFTLVPRQLLYPKFCERHRSEFQRIRHHKRLG